MTADAVIQDRVIAGVPSSTETTGKENQKPPEQTKKTELQQYGPRAVLQSSTPTASRKPFFADPHIADQGSTPAFPKVSVNVEREFDILLIHEAILTFKEERAADWKTDQSAVIKAERSAYKELKWLLTSRRYAADFTVQLAQIIQDLERCLAEQGKNKSKHKPLLLPLLRSAQKDIDAHLSEATNTASVSHDFQDNQMQNAEKPSAEHDSDSGQASLENSVPISHQETIQVSASIPSSNEETAELQHSAKNTVDLSKQTGAEKHSNFVEDNASKAKRHQELLYCIAKANLACREGDLENAYAYYYRAMADDRIQVNGQERDIPKTPAERQLINYAIYRSARSKGLAYLKEYRYDLANRMLKLAYACKGISKKPGSHQRQLLSLDNKIKECFSIDPLQFMSEETDYQLAEHTLLNVLSFYSKYLIDDEDVKKRKQRAIESMGISREIHAEIRLEKELFIECEQEKTAQFIQNFLNNTENNYEKRTLFVKYIAQEILHSVQESLYQEKTGTAISYASKMLRVFSELDSTYSDTVATFKDNLSLLIYGILRHTQADREAKNTNKEFSEKLLESFFTGNATLLDISGYASKDIWGQVIAPHLERKFMGHSMQNQYDESAKYLLRTAVELVVSAQEAEASAQEHSKSLADLRSNFLNTCKVQFGQFKHKQGPQQAAELAPLFAAHRNNIRSYESEFEQAEMRAKSARQKANHFINMHFVSHMSAPSFITDTVKKVLKTTTDHAIQHDIEAQATRRRMQFIYSDKLVNLIEINLAEAEDKAYSPKMSREFSTKSVSAPAGMLRKSH